MVGVMYVYVDTVFGFYGVFFHCLVGFSIIAWTPAVLSVLYTCVLHFCICTCSALLSMFHVERRYRNTLIITIIIIIIIIIVIVVVVVTIIIIIFSILCFSPVQLYFATSVKVLYTLQSSVCCSRTLCRSPSPP